MRGLGFMAAAASFYSRRGAAGRIVAAGAIGWPACGHLLLHYAGKKMFLQITPWKNGWAGEGVRLGHLGHVWAAASEGKEREGDGLSPG
jgi:hypothetical protein